MRDVSFKVTTRRSAVARAELRMSPSTLALIREGRVPKGDPLTVAKVAAVMAAKKTTDWIPYCHPIPIEFVDVRFELTDTQVAVNVEVVSIAKTGVEMEALTAAAAAALNLYDMLKMVDEDMEILSVRLLDKKGGKSDFKARDEWVGAVLVVSDRVSRGEAEDVSGKVLVQGLGERGAAPVRKEVVPDEIGRIQTAVQTWAAEGVDVVVVAGGTGVGPRDVTPEALAPLFDKPLEGVVEAFRRYSQDRFPTAMLSRSVAGTIGSTVVVALPGSPAACADALSALFPALLHARAMVRGGGHP